MYRTSVGYRGRQSERVTTFASIQLSSSVVGSYNDFDLSGSPLLGATPGTIGTGTGGETDGGAIGGPVNGGIGSGPLLNDIGLLGTRDRRRSVYATGGLSAGVSERDTVTASIYGDASRYRESGATSDYDGYGGNLGYSRRLSDYVDAGLQSSFSRYEYNSASGDTNVYSIQATGSVRLNTRWTAQGALGVSLIDSNGVGTTGATSFSGNINVCRRGEQSNMCVVATRSARATGFNGAQYVTIVGANWSLRLNERSSLSLNGSYQQEGGLRALNAVQNQYLAVSPSFSRQLRERLRFVASARYRQIFGGTVNRPSDYGGQVGLSYQLGRL